ncbi:MAG TPA: hypothetical protein PKC30_10315 [Saprospiraceae bacterium]|nr:hypothetical protein [Saprospiraceae bacterium]
MSRKYHGKILLFGEYTILHGGEALAIPSQQFYGHWIFKESKEKPANQDLKNWLDYLKDGCSLILDLKHFEEDLNRGLIFQSNIPLGNGVGSSGAITAALYENYGGCRVMKSLGQIKQELSLIESFFHGQSSGIDPLVSLLHVPVRIIGLDQIEIADQMEESMLNSFFLLDSGKSRNTRSLVIQYLKMREKPQLKRAFDELEIYNQTIIQILCSGNGIDKVPFYFKMISRLQYEVFQPMVVTDIKDIWLNGLISENFYIKLCGAGGGGFYLGYKNSEYNGSIPPVTL